MNKLHDPGLSALLLNIGSELEKADAARSQLEDELTGSRGRNSFLALPQEALEGHLESAVARLTVALDIAQLTGTQAQLAERWNEFLTKPDGIGETKFHSDVDWLDCPALSYLQAVTSGIMAARGNDLNLMEQFEFNKLELLLKKLPHMVLAEGVFPQNEKAIRDVAHKYLELYFTHYTKDIQISGPARPFKPDAGITDLRVAIEFKFASDRSDIQREIAELFEDTSGYSNSKDWTRFICVLYQTKALTSEDRFQAELDKASRKSWKPIVVQGSGNRQNRAHGKPTAKRQPKADASA